MTLEKAIKIVEKYHPSCKVSEYAKDGDTYYFYMIEKDPNRLEMQKMRLLFGSYLFSVDKNGIPKVIPFEQLTEVGDKIDNKLHKI